MTMTRHWTLFFVFLAMFMITTGCWSRRELNDLSIVTGVAIDKHDHQFRVSVQVVDPAAVASKQGAGDRSPVSVYDATGDTIFEAIRKMTTLTPRKLYFSHLRIFVLGEDLAKDGIRNTLDLLDRDHEVRTDFYIVVARGIKAKDIISVLTPLEKNPATKLYTSLKVSEKAWAPTVSVQLDELISAIMSDGKQPVLTGIQIKGDLDIGKSKENVNVIDTPANLQYQGIAVFKNDRLIGWLNEDESKGFSDLTDRLNSTVIEIACGKSGKMAVEIIRSKSKLKGIVKDGKPEVEVTIRSEANVADVECEVDLSKTETIYKLEKEVEKTIKSNVERTVSKAKKLKSDIIGFGEAIHRANPDYWKKAKKEWDQQFPSLPVHFKIEVKIRGLGTTGDSFLNKLKE